MADRVIRLDHGRLITSAAASAIASVTATRTVMPGVTFAAQTDGGGYRFAIYLQGERETVSLRGGRFSPVLTTDELLRSTGTGTDAKRAFASAADVRSSVEP